MGALNSATPNTATQFTPTSQPVRIMPTCVKRHRDAAAAAHWTGARTGALDHGRAAARTVVRASQTRVMQYTICEVVVKTLLYIMHRNMSHAAPYATRWPHGPIPSSGAFTTALAICGSRKRPAALCTSRNGICSCTRLHPCTRGNRRARHIRIRVTGQRACAWAPSGGGTPQTALTQNQHPRNFVAEPPQRGALPPSP